MVFFRAYGHEYASPLFNHAEAQIFYHSSPILQLMPKPKQDIGKPPISNKVKIIVVALIVAIVLLAALTLCPSKPSPLEGRWELQYEKIIEFWLGYEVVTDNRTYDFWVELRGDGMGSFSDGFTFKWTEQNGTILVTEHPPSANSTTMSFKYILEGDTLTASRYIGDGITLEWVYRRI